MMSRKSLRVVIYSLLALLTLTMGGGYLFLRSGKALDLAANKLTAMANELGGGRISYQQLSGTLLEGLQVLDFHYHNGDGSVGLEVAEIRLKLDPLSLVFGLLHVKDIVVEAPRLVVGGRHLTTVADLLRKPDSLSLPSWHGLGRLDHFTVNNGSVWRRQPGGNSCMVKDMELTGRTGFSRLAGIGPWSVWLQLHSGQLYSPALARTVRFAFPKVRLRPSGLEGRNILVQSGESTLQGDFFIPFAASRKVSCEWRDTTIALADFGIASPLVFTTEGHAATLTAPPQLHAADSTVPVREFPDISFVADTVWAGTSMPVHGRFIAPFSGRSQLRLAIGFSALKRRQVRQLLEQAAPSLVSKKGLHMVDSLALDDLSGSCMVRISLDRAPMGVEEGVLTLTGGTLAGIPFSRIRLPFALDSQTAVIRGGQVQFGELGGFSLDLTPAAFNDGHGPGRRAVLSLRELDVRQLLALPQLPGPLNGTIDCTVDQRLTASGTATFAPFSWLGRQFGGGMAHFSAQGKKLEVQELRIHYGGSAVRGRGRILPDHLAFDFETNALPLELLAGEWQGGVKAKMALYGPLDNFRGSLTATAKGLRYHGFQLKDVAVQGDFALTGQQLQVEKGTMGIGRIAGNGLSVADLALQLHRSAAKTYEVQQFQLSLAGRQWQLQHPVLVIGSTDGEGVSVSDMVLEDGRGRLTITAAAAGSAALDLQWRGENIDVQLEKMAWPLNNAAGVVNTKGRVTGSLVEPEVVFQIGYQGRRGEIKSGTLSGRYDGVRVDGTGEMTGLAGERVTFSLAAPGRFDPVSLSWHGALQKSQGTVRVVNVPLAKCGFLSRYACSGTLDGAFTIIPLEVGSVPGLRGEVLLEAGGCRLPRTNILVGDGYGVVAYDGQAFRLSEGELETDRGTISLAGSLAYEPQTGPGALELRAELDSFAFLYLGMHRLVVSGDLAVTGDPEAPFLTGDVVVEQGNFHQLKIGHDQDAADDLVVYASRRDPRGERTVNALADLRRRFAGLALALDITVPETVTVSSPRLQMDLTGALHLGTGDGGFEVDGKLFAKAGQYTVAGRQFTIDGGEIDFDQAKGVNARLQGVASCAIPGTTVTATVSGTIDAPQFALTSEPVMSEEDIKAALLFGKPVQKLSVREREAFQGGVASLVGSALLEKVGMLTGKESLFESFSFYSGTEAQGEESVSIGKYLSDDLLLSYEYVLDKETPGQVYMEYKLRGGFSIESLYSDEQEKSSVDLIWKKDF